MYLYFSFIAARFGVNAKMLFEELKALGWDEKDHFVIYLICGLCKISTAIVSQSISSAKGRPKVTCTVTDDGKRIVLIPKFTPNNAKCRGHFKKYHASLEALIPELRCLYLLFIRTLFIVYL